MSSAALETRLIPRTHLLLSQTESQVERRAHFNKTRIKELAESLEANGMVNPILVRKTPGTSNSYEIVAGERRYMAAGIAEWPDVPCSVRELTDAQVIEVQLTENLDREELHELAEAEGYEALTEHGFTAEQIAAKFGRSPTYVLRRLRLKTLSKSVRRAFYDGKLGFTVALELAKLPIHAHQDALLEQVIDAFEDQWDKPLSAEQVREEAEQRFLSDLKGAPFPTAEAGLVPKAGACQACPKRSGAQGALFDQVKGLGHCLDLVCFSAKKLAHGENLLAAAKDRGQKILRNQAEVPAHLVRLDHQPSHGGKSVKQLLDKDYQPILVLLKSGEVVQVAAAADVKKVLPKERASSDGLDSYKAKQRAEEKKRKLELEYRAQLLRMVVTETMAGRVAGDELADLRLACEAMADRMHHDGKVRLFKVMEWPVREVKDKYRGKVREYDWKPVMAGYETLEDLQVLLRVLSVAGDLEVYNHSDFDRKDRLHKLAERMKLKPAALLAGLKAEAEAKKKPKKKAVRK